jgi:hypothetical protein
VKATLHTAGRSGKLSKRVTVKSNDPVTPELNLDLSGEIVVDVWVEPRAISFGQLGKGEQAQRPLTVNVADPAKFKITSIMLDDERFKMVPETATDGIGSYQLAFSGASELGAINSKLVITYKAPPTAENPTGEERLEAIVRASIVSDLRYAKNLSFIKRDGTFASQDLVFTHRAGNSVKILGVEGAAEHLRFTISEAEGTRAVIKVELVDPSRSYAQAVRDKFIVKTDNADEPESVVQFTIAEAPARRDPRANTFDRPNKAGVLRMERPSNAPDLQLKPALPPAPAPSATP